MRGNRLKVAYKKAKKIFKKWHGFNPDAAIPGNKEWYSDTEVTEKLGVYRKTKVFCSSPCCCGNPRRIRGSHELTYQELRAPDIDEDWYYDE
jgi:hypothetical protein